jgi:tetratricopeptide (TPR) repeat protein
MHQLAFLPQVYWTVGSLLLLLLLLPAIASKVGNLAGGVGRVMFRSPLRLAAASVAAGFLFFAVRLDFPFLGDGIGWVTAFEKGMIFHNFEPLSATLTRVVATRMSPASPDVGAGWLSIFLGPIYVFATGLLARTLWSDASARGLAWILLLLHPMLLLFCGYVEAYPLLIAMQVLFACSLALSMRTRNSFLTILTLALAMAAHVAALAWLPALFVAWARRNSDEQRSWSGVRGLVACVLAVLLTAVVLYAVGASPVDTVRAIVGESGLGAQTLGWMFSLRHVIDLVNELVLLLGPVMVLLAWGVSRGVRMLDPWRDPAWSPIAWMLPGPLLLTWIVEPRIGGGRDWDLFLPLVLPAVLLAVEAWRRTATIEDASAAPAKKRPGRAVKRLQLLPAGLAVAGRTLGLACVAGAAWLAVGIDAPRSAWRLQVLQERPGTFTNFARGYANETLGIYHRDRNRKSARDAWFRATQANPANARYFNNLGMEELRAGRSKEACAAFERALELGMDDYFVLFNMGTCEHRARNLEAAEAYMDRALEKAPGRWEALSARGLLRVMMGRPREALEDQQRAARMAPNDADVQHRMGLALHALGRKEEARAAWERALQLDPKHRAARSRLQALVGTTP